MSVYMVAGLTPSNAHAAEESHPGIAVESMYSEAVLAFNKKQTDQALQILNELLAENPNHLEGLELMALSLKAKGDEAKAIETYQRLIQVKPEKERGPYYFELGMIFNKQKKPKNAKPYFERTIKLDFNRNMSQFFLGMINFGEGNLNAAEASFNELKEDSNPELKMMGHYFLGLIHFKNGYGSGGTHEMTRARNLARAFPSSNKTAQDILKTTEQILAPFNRSQTFGNLTLLGQYDSNIATLPASMASSNASSQATPNLLLSGGVGYMSTPTGTLQWVGNYRFNLNKTTNSLTKSYEYFGHSPALFLNLMPLSRTTGGLKLEGNLTFQNQPKIAGDMTGAYIYRRYLTYGNAGLYFKTELSKTVQSELEGSYKTTSITTDPNQSGPSMLGRFSIKSTSASNAWNPGGAVSFEKFDAQGAENVTSSLGLSLFNTLKFGGANLLNFSVDYVMTSYPEAITLRSDKTLTARLSNVYSLSARWALLGDLTYIKNTSNLVEAFSYNRFMVGAGIGFTL